MAEPYRKNGRWYLRVKGLDDRWHDIALSPKAAPTKAVAKTLQAEYEAKIQRQRLGLEPVPAAANKTVTELCDWWLAECCSAAGREDERLRLRKHVAGRELGRLQLRVVTSAAIDGCLREMHADGAAAASLNKVRSVLHTVFSRARKAGLWTGVNPVADVETRRVPKRAYATLRAEEVPAVLDQTPDEWRGVVATGIYAGLRKGEILGLRKSDVDLDQGEMTIARSYDRDTTKGGHADKIPIPDPLAPFLAGALATAPGALVFPWADGTMRTKGSDPQKVLRHALGRAGIVEGYDHSCRRCQHKGAPHVERHGDRARRECPACGMKLWVKAIPRPLRFHDLRHSAATILLRSGVDAHRVQRILRHRDIKTTTAIYGHLDVEDLRDAVNRPYPGVSTATLYRLCDTGKLVHVRVLNAYRIAPEALDAFIRAQGVK